METLPSPRNFICINCGYPLKGLQSWTCPECGQAFDPADPRTFGHKPIGPIVYPILFTFMGIFFIALGTLQLYQFERRAIRTDAVQVEVSLPDGTTAMQSIDVEQYFADQRPYEYALHLSQVVVGLLGIALAVFKKDWGSSKQRIQTEAPPPPDG